MQKILAIDPGWSGGIVLRNTDGEIEEVHAMPKSEQGILDLIGELSGKNVTGVMELVHAFPFDTPLTAWKFASNAAAVRQAMRAFGIPFFEVSPRKWQKGLGVEKRGKEESRVEFKRRLKALAEGIFTGFRVTLKNCDALLISEYALQNIDQFKTKPQ